MCCDKVALVSFSSKQSSPAGQQYFFSAFIVAGKWLNVMGRLSEDPLNERGLRVLSKLPQEVESSDPRVRDIEGHLMIAIGADSEGLK